MADSGDRRHDATLRDFLNVVFRWKYLILLIFLGTTFAMIFARASKPTTYVASARLLVERGERPSVFATTPRYLNWAEEMSSQLEVVLSEAVFSGARRIFADSLQARGIPGSRTFNAGSVRAEVVGESNVIVIAYSGLDPLTCELGCAAMTESYIAYYREATAPPEMEDFFVSEIDDALAELTEWRQRKSELLAREEYVGVQEAGTHLMYKLSRFETEITAIESDLSVARMQLAKLKELVELPMDELEQRFSATSTESQVQSRAMSDIRWELQRHKTRREELLARYTEKHPEVIAVQSQIDDLRDQLRQEVQNAYDLALNDYEQLAAKLATVRGSYAQTQQEIAGLPEKQKELSRIESNIRANEERYQLLVAKQHEAAIAVATSEDFEIAVLSPPSKASARRTGDYVRLAFGPFLSLIVALGLAFFLESMDHSLKNPAEVEQYLGTRVLATVAEERRKT